MSTRARRIARAATVAAAIIGLAISAAGVAAAANGEDNGNWEPHNNLDRVAYPGMYIDNTGDMSPSYKNPTYTYAACTLGAVGTDSAGRKIGITAGHCNPGYKAGEAIPGFDEVLKYDSAPRGVEITDNKHPIFDRNAAKFVNKASLPLVEPIGWIRWVDDDVCDIVNGVKETAMNMTLCDANHPVTDIDSTTDYMVIEFAPDVQLTSQVYDANGQPVKSTHPNAPDFKVNSVYTNSNGQPELPPQGGLLPATYKYIEHFGAMSAREPGNTPSIPPYLAEAPSDGTVTSVDTETGMFRAAAPHQGGDSGGPVVIRGTGQWVGIITMSSQHWYDWPSPKGPFIFTSAKNILNDLNDNDKYPNRTYGRGFAPINN